MAKASENVFPKVQFSEETAPATPSTGEAVVYVKSDGKLYLKDDAGTETDLTSGGGGSSIAESAKANRSSTTQSISDGTNTAIQFDTEEWDDNGLIDLATNNTRLTVQTAGKYVIDGGVVWAANSSGLRQVAIRKNGTTILQAQGITASSDNQGGNLSVSAVDDASVSDYYEIIAFQSSGGSLNIQASVRCNGSIVRVA